MGRPPHKPTDEQRNFVKMACASGIPHKDIAKAIGVSRVTLDKHYREELDLAKTKANAKVAQTLFQMATSGKCPAATFFWLKTQAGWREKQELDITSNGEHINDPLAGLSVEEKKQALRARLEQLEESERIEAEIIEVKGISDGS